MTTNSPNELRQRVNAIISAAVVPEEQELADALVEIAEKYGKFNDDDTGVWAGYEPAAENEKAKYGVMCANCMLYEGGNSCKIIAASVEPGGYCRFALIPDGIVKKPEPTVAAAGDVEEVLDEEAPVEEVDSPFDERRKYVSGVNQPRDSKGKFRKVLARLKQDLGTSGLQNVVDKVREAEDLSNAGNYVRAVAAASDLLKIIDRLDAGSLDATALENVRNSARELGNVISNLPLPFGEESEKVKFSDLPPVLKKLIDDMISRVEEKIGKEDADVATQKLRSYKGGGDLFSQGEVSSEMGKMLRLLT